jgi:hypothetical protein
MNAKDVKDLESLKDDFEKMSYNIIYIQKQLLNLLEITTKIKEQSEIVTIYNFENQDEHDGSE